MMQTEVARPWGAVSIITLGGLASFNAYFAMYAFRKPFTATSYEGVEGWDFAIDFKIALVIAQVLGYALSKLIGVKVIAEMGRNGRGVAIITLIGVAWAALIAFALLPTPAKPLALFLNGLPLGLIWGLVFSYLEGRRVTEALGAILCASFILSSGVVKSVGGFTMQTLQVPALWMPAVTGAMFFPLLFLSVYGLTRLPPPSAEDETARTRRAPMDANARSAFLREYGPGVAFLVLAYVLFTAFRDFRDNFAAEIWSALGRGGDAAVFSLSEAPVAAIALAGLAAMMAIRSNKAALLVTHGMMLLGAIAIGASTVAFQSGIMDPLAWMIVSGAGLYLCYTPFNAMLFDRMIAATKVTGTAGFLIYIADALGYLGSVALLILKNFVSINLDWLAFFTMGAYATSAVSFGLIAMSALYFATKLRTIK